MTDRELMQQALTDCPYTSEELRGAFFDGFMKASARLAQPEPEPVAWHEPGAYGNVTVHAKWANENGWQPLYTAPPQREWQGLTDEDIKALWDGHIIPVFNKSGISPFVFARAIEANLREKNA